MTKPNASPADLIGFAIDRGICVLADYNRSEAVLAPQKIEERHGESFVKAVTLETDGRVPKVLKMGTFKVAGLGNIECGSESDHSRARVRVPDHRDEQPGLDLFL